MPTQLDDIQTQAQNKSYDVTKRDIDTLSLVADVSKLVFHVAEYVAQAFFESEATVTSNTVDLNDKKDTVEKVRLNSTTSNHNVNKKSKKT